jgi:hypothetical protein
MADGLGRINEPLIPSNVRAFAKSLVGMAPSQGDFNAEDLALMNQQVRAQIAETGQDKGEVSFYPGGSVDKWQEMTPVSAYQQSRKDPGLRLATSVGKGGYYIDDRGDAHVIDQYDFNATKRGKGLNEVAQSENLFNALYNLGGFAVGGDRPDLTYDINAGYASDPESAESRMGKLSRTK